MRNVVVLFILFLFSLSIVLAGEPVKAENFTLPDYNGAKHTLTDFNKAKAVVLMFIATQCPVSNGYNTRMVSLYNDYKDKNVVFIGINSNKQESVEEVKQHAKDHGFEFTILKDDKNIIADKFGASVTPKSSFSIRPSRFSITAELMTRGGKLTSLRMTFEALSMKSWPANRSLSPSRKLLAARSRK